MYSDFLIGSVIVWFDRQGEGIFLVILKPQSLQHFKTHQRRIIVIARFAAEFQTMLVNFFEQLVNRQIDIFLQRDL